MSISKSKFCDIVKKLSYLNKNQTAPIPKHLYSFVIGNVSFDEILDYLGIQAESISDTEIKILCPFHDDNNPSLHINSEKGVYICRACGEGGNKIDFIRQYLKIGFTSAINIMAKIKGLNTFEPQEMMDFAVRQYELNKEKEDKNEEVKIGGLSLEDLNIKISSMCGKYLMKNINDIDFIENIYKKFDDALKKSDREILNKINRKIGQMLLRKGTSDG